MSGNLKDVWLQGLISIPFNPQENCIVKAKSSSLPE
jgi:hypothetical protein